jgi:hypothetical protein
MATVASLTTIYKRQLGLGFFSNSLYCLLLALLSFVSDVRQRNSLLSGDRTKIYLFVSLAIRPDKSLMPGAMTGDLFLQFTLRTCRHIIG